jgi:hypothetical protein
MEISDMAEFSSEREKHGVRFTGRIRARCPAALPPAIEMAAAQALMTPSEYIRRSIIDRLKADGIDLRTLPSLAGPAE